MNKNILIVVGITILFLGTCINPSVAIDNVKKSYNSISYGNTLYVGGTGEGNYTKIQYAIDNASNGDTIFVYDDSSPYYENLLVNKSINLIGEDRNTTIIHREGYGSVVVIKSDYINLSGFTIQINAPPHFYRCGVDIFGPIKNVNIFNNIIRKNEYGFQLRGEDGPVDVRIYNNIITNNTIGITDYCSHEDSHIEIYHNIISDNEEGITGYCNYYIFENHISKNGIGIYCCGGISYFIHHNQISFNNIGIKILNCIDAKIYNNNLFLNKRHVGISRMGLLSDILFIRMYKQNWSNNFWGRPRLLPKTITGVEILFFEIWFWRVYIPIPIAIFPYSEFDWHPALKPYDIDV